MAEPMTCPAGMKLVAGPVLHIDPDNNLAPICVDETEVTQADYLAWESLQKSTFELMQNPCGTEKWEIKATGDSAKAVSVSPYNVRPDGKKVCGVKISQKLPQSTIKERPEIEEKYAGPKKPMINVSWNNANNYCLAHGKRPLTSDEWEKAARGPQGYDYATASGELKLTEANFWDSEKGDSNGPVDVKSYAPNGFGLYDMTGNVLEWVSDGGTSSRTKGFRGGSWSRYSGDWYLRADSRFDDDEPEFRDINLGFRCGKTAKPSGE